MRLFACVIVGVAAWAGISGWRSYREANFNRSVSRSRSRVGTDPGCVCSGGDLKPASGDLLVGFSAGCFWGSEEAFRKMPGIVATAVGFTGGTSVNPTYQVAHATGHEETVLVEFNPKLTPFSSLLKTFWTLRRTNELDGPELAKTTYRPAIWTYDAAELKQAIASRDAIEAREHVKLRVKIQPAVRFYLAEAYHQQYDEKSGTEACPLP